MHGWINKQAERGDNSIHFCSRFYCSFIFPLSFCLKISTLLTSLFICPCLAKSLLAVLVSVRFIRHLCHCPFIYYVTFFGVVVHSGQLVASCVPLWPCSGWLCGQVAFTQTRVRVQHCPGISRVFQCHGLWKLHSYEWSVDGHLYNLNITRCLLAILDEIESRKCFVNKTTMSYHKVTIFINCTSLTMNSFTMMSVLTSYTGHSFYKLY